VLSMSYRRLAPLTTMLMLRLPHCELMSRLLQSGRVVSAPYRSAISAGSGSTLWRQSLHHTMNRKCAFAVLPSVAGGPGSDFIIRQRLPRSPRRYRMTRLASPAEFAAD
jgi:hypothetical protein